MGTEVNRSLLLLFFICLLTACASSVDEASQRHTYKSQQWKALADFAGHELLKSEITITANIMIVENDNKKSFSIDSIQLSKTKGHSEIDLLAPEFFDKYICNDSCYFISEMISDDEGSQTKLSDFFYENEGSFFSFYAEITLLNQRLRELQSIDHKNYLAYLKMLLEKNQKFTTLKAFTEYLAKNLNEDAYFAYLQNRFEQQRLVAESNDGLLYSNDSVYPDEMPVVAEESLAFSDEIPTDGLEQIDIGFAFPADLESDSKASEGWLSARDVLDENSLTEDDKLFMNLVEDNMNGLPLEIGKQNNWDGISSEPIKVGGIVCSISKNTFGVVTEINERNVSVELMGEAKTVVDGLVVNPVPGYLANNFQEFYYMERNNLVSYPKSDVTNCNIDYLSEEIAAK